MHAAKVVAKIDKVLEKERELTNSRLFHTLGIQAVVDCHFTQQRSNNAVCAYVISKNIFDVTLVKRDGYVCLWPSIAHKALEDYDDWFTDGVGVLTRKNLKTLLTTLSAISDGMAHSGPKAVNGGVTLGPQAPPDPTPKERKGASSPAQGARVRILQRQRNA